MVLSAVVFLSCILLDKARKTISVRELRRRARSSNNRSTSVIYKLAAQGGALNLFLWLVGSASGAALFIGLTRISVWAAAAAIFFGGWLALSARPLKDQGFLWKIAGVLSVPTLNIVSFLHPVLAKFSNFIGGLRPAEPHSGLFDRDDLLGLIDAQLRQKDNRIPPEDLKIARGALTFGDKLVREVMVPMHKVKLAAAADPIGPLLMDELHASGFGIFPVVESSTKKSSSNIVGALYLKDVLNHAGAGRVRDVMRKGVHSIEETQNLRDALKELLKNQHHLLIVVNNFGENAGVISLEDVMEQIFGVSTK